MRYMRRGFSLLEVLVVVGILLIILSLLLPGIQSVRQSAGRLSCQNNLKQIGLALHQYHDSNEHFPIGYDDNASIKPFRRFSWRVQLLGYLEQYGLRSEIDSAAKQGDWIESAEQRELAAKMVRVFQCPSDDRVSKPQNVPGYLLTIGLSSYLGVQGLDYQDSGGMMLPGLSVRIAQITDGTANTLMIGERPPSTDFVFGWWYTGIGTNDRGSADHILGVREKRPLGNFGNVQTCPIGPYSYIPGDIDRFCDMFHFWSQHSGGANFLLADGSVRMIPYTANSIMPALASKMGGEVVALPD